MSAYTRLGAHIWSWEPFTQLSSDARILWLALYTSAEAKRIVPGLWHGSIAAMADAARMPVDEVHVALDKLLEAELVEYDKKLRVLRMTVLPDCGESPPNGRVIRSWFIRWKSVPACAVRDAHVPTLRWLMDEWSRDSGKPISADHEKVWSETFGLVVVPVPRRRGIRRLADSSTGTGVQPGLFDPPSPKPSGEGSDTVSGAGGSDPEVIARGISPSGGQINDSSGLDTVSDTVSKRYGSGSGSGSQVPEVRSDPPGDHVREAPPPTSPARPRLTLVPPPPGLPLTPAGLVALLAANSRGRYSPGIRGGAEHAITTRIGELEAAGVARTDLERLGQWLARGYGPIDRLGGDPDTKLSMWASYPGAIMRALDDARAREYQVRQHEEAAQDRHEALQEALQALGWAKETVS